MPLVPLTACRWFLLQSYPTYSHFMMCRIDCGMLILSALAATVLQSSHLTGSATLWRDGPTGRLEVTLKLPNNVPPCSAISIQDATHRLLSRNLKVSGPKSGRILQLIITIHNYQKPPKTLSVSVGHKTEVLIPIRMRFK